MQGKITIVQPGRLGDIILVLPIAHYYCKQGFDIIWPVCLEYIDIFKNIKFLKNMAIYNIGSINDYQGSVLRAFASSFIGLGRHCVDLAIGFGNPALDNDWKKTGLSFDIWKYNKVGLEYQEKYNLRDFIIRDLNKEAELMKLKGVRKEDNYVVVHENGSHGRYFDFLTHIECGMQMINIENIKGYNIFNWLTILENADAIYCVDSCIANLVDQYEIIPEKGRFFHPWKEYYTPLQLKLLTPKIKDDWVII